MEFLKNFFNDESTVIGLCKFEKTKHRYCQTPVLEEIFFQPFLVKSVYKTDTKKNIFLY